MAWNKVTKEELKEAGLDMDAFTTAMGKVSKIDGLETAIGEVKKNLEGLDAIKQSLTALETKLNEPRVTSSNGNPSGNANNNPNIGGGTSAEPDLDWVLEPAKATESTVSRLVGPLINATAEMRAQMNYNNFAGGRKKGFVRYEKEIKELWDKQNLVAKQNPELVENCYKVVIANHLDEIQRGGETFFVEASGSAGTHVDVNEKRKATEVLNKDQLDMCAKWGVDPEDYLRELTAGGSTAYVS